MPKLLFVIVPSWLSVFGTLSGTSAEALTPDEVGRIVLFQGYGAADVSAEGIAKARREFEGRGPALAQYFLNHQSPPHNDAYYFLFRTIGDVRTAQILIRALSNPPTPVDSVLPRYPGEVEVAVEMILEREAVRSDPAILASLAEARKEASGAFPEERFVSLMGKLGTVEALQSLQMLCKDPDPAIRVIAIRALGETGAASAETTLAESMRRDQSASVRAEAADAIGLAATGDTVSSLLASLDQESDLAVVDSILRSLASLQAVPGEAEVCLGMAERGWEIGAVRPFFNGWRKSASGKDLIGQAVSSSWPVRALALEALSRAPREGLSRLGGPRFNPPPALDEKTKGELLQSVVEILSQDMVSSPTENRICHETAYLAKQALWEISGNDMALALTYADRIEPSTGRHDHIGRFGASSYLASQDEAAYTAIRRPGQLFSVGLLLLVWLPLLAWSKTRMLGAGLILGTGGWILAMAIGGGVHDFPPPPLGFLTIPALAFLSAGLVAGLSSMMGAVRWIKLMIAPLSAGLGSLLLCGVTRGQGFYPIGSGGWELYLDPVGCALLAALAAFLMIIGLLWWPKWGRT